MSKILLSGSAGFIFSNFLLWAEKENINYTFICVDKLVAKYNSFNINPNHKFYMADIADEHFMDNVFRIEKPDIVIHGAAESFVCSSIENAKKFVFSNVLGTQTMIDMSIKYGVERFIYSSTDEIYGQLNNKDQSWTENSIPNPRNPYSASKYAGEIILKAAHETHNLQYNISRSCNNFGGRQPPRNLVPKIITSLLQGKKIPIHGTGSSIREWIYVDDNCSAIATILNNGPANQTYNIGSGVEKTNLEMVEEISNLLNIKDWEDRIEFVPERKGVDKRYSVDCDKIKKLGWKPKHTFNMGLDKCVDWYVSNLQYLDWKE